MFKFIRIAIFAMLAAASAHLAGADLPPPPNQVVLQLKWKHQFQFAGYYAAIAQGFYKDAGLDVVLHEAEPGQDAVREVLSGRANFGVGTSDLLLKRQHGDPVVVLAAIFQHSPLVLLTREGSGIKDIQDVLNQPIMIEPESAELYAYFKYEGVDPAKLKVVPHTFDIADLLSGKVAAMSAYSTDEPYRLTQAGVKPLVFTPRAGGIDFYGDNLFTTEAELRDHPDRVRAFREASLKGWQFAMDHPEQIVDLILKTYNTQGKTREQLLFEARQTADLMHPELIEVGHMNPGRWQRMAETYAEFNMLPRDFPLVGFLYDPNPTPNFVPLYWTLAIVSVMALVAWAWILPLHRLNSRLRENLAREHALSVELGHAKNAAESLLVELRQAKDAAESADDAKGRYLAVMSHEVRTPLSGLISLTELLQEEMPAPERQQTLAIMRTTGEEMLKLINDILEYSKIESGRLELDQQQMEVSALVDDLCRLYSASAREKSLEFKVEVAPGTPAVINTDVQRVRQILSNLLVNALKFTESGQVSLALSARREPAATLPGAPPLWRWHFVVQDTGLGISPVQASGLFNPYAQAHPGIARRFGGTGLGLAISRQLARLLGGDLVLAESAPGRGATFVLEIVAQDGAMPA